MSTLSNPQISLAVSALLQAGAAPAIGQWLIDQSPPMSVSIGSSAGQVQRSYSAPISVVSGTPFTLNLISGLDPSGAALGFSELVLWLLENDSVTTGQNLVLGGGTHPVLGSDQATVFPGISPSVGVGFGFNPVGWTVTGGSTDTLTITAATGTIAGKLTLFSR